MSVNLWIGVEVELGRIKLSKYYLVDKIRNRIRCESFKTKQKQIEIFISDKVNYILKLIVITINYLKVEYFFIIMKITMCFNKRIAFKSILNYV